MAVAYLKIVVAVILTMLMIIVGEIGIVYSTKLRVQNALENAADGAIVFNIRDEALAYGIMDIGEDEDKILQVFYDIFIYELGLDSILQNRRVFDGPIKMADGPHVNFRDFDYPAVTAEVEATVRTGLLTYFTKYPKFTVNNYDQFYWQWVQKAEGAF